MHRIKREGGDIHAKQKEKEASKEKSSAEEEKGWKEEKVVLRLYEPRLK